MIIVFGSVTMEMVFRPGALPQAGEPALCEDYEILSGGKGANQALAAARLGGKVALVGCVGDDGPALRMLRALRRDGVMTTGVAEHPELLTGCAVTITAADAQTHTLIAGGANRHAKAQQVPDEILKPGNIVLMQMEMTPEENWALIDRAHARGATTMLNLAPAINVSKAALEKLDYLIVNQVEARQMAAMLGLSADKDVTKMAAALARQGNLTCVITMGNQGAVACDKDGRIVTAPALKLEPAEVVDITGAGDAWCGTFAAAIHDGKSLEDAMRMASVAGSLACLKKGAQESFAFLGDIEKGLERL